MEETRDGFLFLWKYYSVRVILEKMIDRDQRVGFWLV